MAFAAAGWFGATAGGCGPELEDEATAAVGATTGAGGGAAVDEVNGCTLSEAEDQRGETEVVISFGGALGNVYDPQCVLVDAGTIIRFVGDFDFHPLRGGVSGAEDPGSDIPAVDTGTEATAELDAAGDHPYFCTFHAGFGMAGVIYAQ